MIENNFSFLTDKVGYHIVETKEGKKYYVTGYISTKDIDLVDDLVTDDCLTSMLKQLNTGRIKIDVEHEAYKENSNIIPIGKIIEAKKDEKGVWIKAELNSSLKEKFKEVWDSIKGGFIDAFSITFIKPLEVTRQMGDKTIRLLNDLTLLNVALTGNPANPQATIDSFDYKSKSFSKVITKSLDSIKQEVDLMPEIKAVEPIKEIVEIKEVQPVETPVEIKEEPKTEVKNYDKEIAELKALLEESNKSVAEMKAVLEQPVFKATLEDKPIAVAKVYTKGPLDLF